MGLNTTLTLSLIQMRKLKFCNKCFVYKHEDAYYFTGSIVEGLKLNPFEILRKRLCDLCKVKFDREYAKKDNASPGK